MSNPDILIKMDDNDVLSFVKQAGGLADSLFGPAGTNGLVDKTERLLSDGRYARLLRQTFSDNGLVLTTDIRGLLFNFAQSVEEEAEEDEIPYRAFEGNCVEFSVDGQRSSLQVTHSIGRLLVDCLGEVSYEPESFTGMPESEDEEEPPVLTDLMVLPDMQKILMS